MSTGYNPNRASDGKFANGASRRDDPSTNLVGGDSDFRNDPMTPEEATVAIRQIGTRNLMAISGGRKHLDEKGRLVLPVSNGYKVRVGLDKGADLYTVERVYSRFDKKTMQEKEFSKGRAEHLMAQDLGERCYMASCFRSYDADEWPHQT